MYEECYRCGNGIIVELDFHGHWLGYNYCEKCLLKVMEERKEKKDE